MRTTPWRVGRRERHGFAMVSGDRHGFAMVSGDRHGFAMVSGDRPAWREHFT